MEHLHFTIINDIEGVIPKLLSTDSKTCVEFVKVFNNDLKYDLLMFNDYITEIYNEISRSNNIDLIILRIFLQKILRDMLTLQHYMLNNSVAEFMITYDDVPTDINILFKIIKDDVISYMDYIITNNPCTIRKTDDYQTQLIHICASVGTKEMLNVLIKHKADINAKDCSNITPAMYAANRKDKSCLILLCKLGANITCKNNYGMRVIDYLAEKKSDLKKNLKLGNDYRIFEKNNQLIVQILE